MAVRRMFSKNVITSGRFLRMPQSSRLLYYDLGMTADDDGIVEAFTVIRSTGATEDDLRVLAARKFVTILNDDLVSYINEWHENNYIRPDRYTPSIYTELLVKVADFLPETVPDIPSDNRMSTDGIPNVYQCRPQVRLGKVRLGKEIDGGTSAPNRKRFAPPSLDEIREYMTEYAVQHGMQIDAALQAEKFFNFHDSRGWISGKSGQTMKRWKGAAGTWMCNLREWAKDQPQPKRSTGNGPNWSDPVA